MLRKREIRCFCARRPLLGYLFHDETGKLNFHIKVYKANRIFGEILIQGSAIIRCRECLRWHAISMNEHEFTIHPVNDPTTRASMLEPVVSVPVT